MGVIEPLLRLIIFRSIFQLRCYLTHYVSSPLSSLESRTRYWSDYISLMWTFLLEDIIPALIPFTKYQCICSNIRRFGSESNVGTILKVTFEFALFPYVALKLLNDRHEWASVVSPSVEVKLWKVTFGESADVVSKNHYHYRVFSMTSTSSTIQYRPKWICFYGKTFHPKYRNPFLFNGNCLKRYICV